MNSSQNNIESKIILAIGTEWFSKKGGLSTFNRQLCIGLSAKNHRVFCYLPEYTQLEESDAMNFNVTLVKPAKKNFTSETEDLFKKPPISEDIIFDLIIGHDRITGPAMKEISEKFYPKARTAFFIHTTPSETDFHKPEQPVNSLTEKISEKEDIQKSISQIATIVAAVGPHLYFEAQSLLAGEEKEIKIIQFNPGLSKPFDEINYKPTSLTPEALILGRVEDFNLKGVDIAVKAMHVVYNNWVKKVNGIVLKPKLIIRGSKEGSDEELIKKLREIESSKLRIQPKNYSSKIDAINEDIRKTRIVLIPSRAEGFGLVGIEAISNGRPFLISERSGFAQLLQQIDPNEAEKWIIPEAIDDNVSKWASSIQNILENPETTSENLKLIAKKYSENVQWDFSIDKLLSSLYNDSSQPTIKLTDSDKSKNERPTKVEYGVQKHLDGQFEIIVNMYEFFDSRMAQAFPGIRGLSWMNEPSEIYERLKILLKAPLSFTIYPNKNDELMGGNYSPIWWYRGGASLAIKDFEMISDKKCLIGSHELIIEKIAVYRHDTPYRSFIYVKAKKDESALKPADLESRIKSRLSFWKYADEEFAIYKDHFVSREEYDDGAALIDGKPHNFTQTPILRRRFLTPYNFIISVQSSVYNSNASDRIFGRHLDDFLKSGNENNFNELLDELENLDEDRVHILDFYDYY